MILTKEESFLVDGGAYRFSASIFSAASRFIKTLYDIGYSYGSSLRRIISQNYCY